MTQNGLPSCLTQTEPLHHDHHWTLQELASVLLSHLNHAAIGPCVISQFFSLLQSHHFINSDTSCHFPRVLVVRDASQNQLSYCLSIPFCFVPREAFPPLADPRRPLTHACSNRTLEFYSHHCKVPTSSCLVTLVSGITAPPPSL